MELFQIIDFLLLLLKPGQTQVHIYMGLKGLPTPMSAEKHLHQWKSQAYIGEHTEVWIVK